MPSRRRYRSEDDQLLAMLRMRALGWNTAQIAMTCDMNDSAIRTATNRVLAADLAESGEDRKAVAACYWGR